EDEPDAADLLATMFDSGQGIPRNPTEAARLRANAASQRQLNTPLLKSDQQSDLRAQAGMLAFEEKDFLEAFAKLKPLADQGDPAAQIRLADMYAGGLGIPRNPGEAD